MAPPVDLQKVCRVLVPSGKATEVQECVKELDRWKDLAEVVKTCGPKHEGNLSECVDTIRDTYVVENGASASLTRQEAVLQAKYIRLGLLPASASERQAVVQRFWGRFGALEGPSFCFPQVGGSISYQVINPPKSSDKKK